LPAIGPRLLIEGCPKSGNPEWDVEAINSGKASAARKASDPENMGMIFNLAF
jgi:hypothetical protein